MNTDYSFPYTKKEGSLHTRSSNRAGKRFAIWSYKPVNSDRFDIEVLLLYKTTEKPLRFSASSVELSKTYETSDIEELRILIENDLNRSCYLLNNIKWEEWYEVTVSGSNNARHGNKSEFKISYGKLKRGINPENGEVVTIHNNHIIIGFPKPKKSGQEDEDFFSSHGHENEVSYIPATDDNTAALELLTTKLGILRKEISLLLSQENITRSLNSIDINLIEHK